ncbi:MAG: putative metal-binding motif-containing protein [Myxococcota bacterium]
MWAWLAAGCGGAELGEQCANGVDDDRNGAVDCDDRACARHCDTDGDGFVDARLRGGTDCDDDDAAVNPDAPERCNRRDDDCDGLVDDDDPDIEADQVPGTRLAQHVDADGDGFGTDKVGIACIGAPGWAAVAGDCDDDDPRVATGLPEVCDGVDNDCDGLVDGDDPDLQGAVTVFQDRDGDGHGAPGVARLGCVGEGWSADPLDCDDTHATVYGGAEEVCDGLDNDCDGVTGPEERDGDGDGDPVCTDCDDTDPRRSSRLEEVCSPDAVDEDCDGLVDGIDPSLNPYTCGYCPPAPPLVLLPPIHEESWNPCLLDPATEVLCSQDPLHHPEAHDDGARLHRIRWRTDEGHWRPQLFLFLPPGPGDENLKILEWAAFAGYRTISLGYPNQDTLDQACDNDHADACYRDVLYERMYGVDRSPLFEVGPADSLVGRLTTLLEHLTIVHPEMGFERYRLPDGSPDWTQIVVAGWSGGGGQAAFVSKYEPVAAGILMSAPKDHDTADLTPVDWVAAPGVTPGCALLSTYHRDEPFSSPPVAILPRAWDLMGIVDHLFDIDRNPGVPIPRGTTRIAQSADVDQVLPPSCNPHAAVGRDGCLRDSVFPAYVYLMCTAATLDPQTCEEDAAPAATAARTGR